MKPGNRHESEMVPNHTKHIALKDERLDKRLLYNNVKPFCPSAGRLLLFYCLVEVARCMCIEAGHFRFSNFEVKK